MATVLTGAVGLLLKKVIEHVAFPHGGEKAEVEQLFANMPLIATSLAVVGLFIVAAGLMRGRSAASLAESMGMRESIWMGAIQGLCLPFRGFSRSGSTISTGMVMGVTKRSAEEFSFALGVILTPAVMGYELLRLGKATGGVGPAIKLFLPGGGFFAAGAVGLVCSFIAGMLALKWLSSWLEKGRWHFFGCYCLVAAAVVLLLHLLKGY